MGYTHYWETDKAIEDDVWDKIAKEASMVALRSTVAVQYESDNDALPCFDSTQIRFNGVGREGHETFVLTPNVVGFDFCKTAIKPYDVIVVAILIIATHHAGDRFSWSSDGEPEEMRDSLALLKSCGLDYKVNMRDYEEAEDDEPLQWARPTLGLSSDG